MCQIGKYAREALDQLELVRDLAALLGDVLLRPVVYELHARI